MRAHALLTLLFVLSRAGLDLAGVRFYFTHDWMWMSDPADLRDRLFQTLVSFHAFPPGMDALTGILLKAGDARAPALGHAVFWVLGLVLVNGLFVLGRAAGVPARAAFVLALAFMLSPPAIYFEHLYLYDWPVATLLVVAAVLFHRAAVRPSLPRWLACFAVCAVIGLTRSTFHLVWFVAVVALALWLIERRARQTVVTAALIPALVLLSLYVKNLVLFGEFAASRSGRRATRW